MSHIAYVNGRYLPYRQAQLSIDDRATQFADAVYEVTCIWNGVPVDHGAHLARLSRSLAALQIPEPCSHSALTAVCREVVRRNRVTNGTLYMQVSRGVAPRAHPFPAGKKPGVIVTSKNTAAPSQAMAEKGVKVIAMRDNRWGRCDIKTVGLLGNVLAKQAAVEEGAFEALLYDAKGTVTEASTSNAWIVANDGSLVTHPLGPEILGGVTRATIIGLARAAGYKVVERTFSLDEALSAREVFLTGTTTFVMPVVQVDDKVIANGAPGSSGLDLRRRYQDYVEQITASAAAWDVA